MSKLGPKCQYFMWPPLFSSTALTLLGMEFTRASQVATGVLFHSSMTTSRSWWTLETLRSSTFRLRMPYRCSIGFRSGDMLGQSITFTLSFFSKAVVVLEVCLGSLSCWNTALRPSLRREGIMLCFSMSQYIKSSQVKSALLSILPHVQYIHTENWNCVTLWPLVHTVNIKHWQ